MIFQLISGLGFRGLGVEGFRVQGLGFRVLGLQVKEVLFSYVTLAGTRGRLTGSSCAESRARDPKP